MEIARNCTGQDRPILLSQSIDSADPIQILHLVHWKHYTLSFSGGPSETSFLTVYIRYTSLARINTRVSVVKLLNACREHTEYCLTPGDNLLDLVRLLQ